ncbi:MAG: DUF167 domain-containing protein [Candidatus Omnitrophota bacterium]
MKVSVSVQPRSSKEAVVKNSDGTYKVYLKQSPVDGKANKSLISVLAEYFNTKKRSVKIITGITGRKKIIEID